MIISDSFLAPKSPRLEKKPWLCAYLFKVLTRS